MTDEQFAARVAAIAVLGDPTRRLLYRYVADAAEPVAREQAAAALGIPHHTRRPLEFARETLDVHGFEPRTDGARVVLMNCPFRALAPAGTGGDLLDERRPRRRASPRRRRPRRVGHT
jgi:hypothetical protein